MVAFSRRSLLQLATAGSAAAFLTSNTTAAFAASPTPGLPSVETSPGAIDAYVASTRFSGMVRLSDINAEYQHAAAMFPLTLPDDWTFPADSGLTDPPQGALWERGSGVGAAFLIWQQAVAAKAYAASQSHDTVAAKRYLDLLEAGYATDVRKAYLMDLGDGDVSRAAHESFSGLVSSARNGNFSALRQYTAPRSR